MWINARVYHCFSVETSYKGRSFKGLRVGMANPDYRGTRNLAIIRKLTNSER